MLFPSSYYQVSYFPYLTLCYTLHFAFHMGFLLLHMVLVKVPLLHIVLAKLPFVPLGLLFWLQVYFIWSTLYLVSSLFFLFGCTFSVTTPFIPLLQPFLFLGFVVLCFLFYILSGVPGPFFYCIYLSAFLSLCTLGLCPSFL